MIPLSKLFFDEADYKAVMEVMRSGYISQGEKVQEFESALASYIGVAGGVATSSGTAALHLALIALDIREGEEVILPSYVCTAPLNAIYYTGAKAVIVDINEDDFNLSIREAKKKLTGRTKAIIIPHMFGQPADMDAILSIGVPIIEDCAHSIGATYNGRMVGGMGVVSIFSFYATKMLAVGEGGMVLSNDEKLLSKIKDIRDYDKKDDFKVRFNYKMTDIEAALGLSQLKKLPSFIIRRKEIAKMYSEALVGCNFELPALYEGKEHIFYRYIIKISPAIENHIKSLRKRDIECRRPVYKPLHLYFGLKDFPVAEKVHNQALSIPIYPSLTDREVNFIIEAIPKVLK